MFVRGSSFLLAVDESTTIKNPKAKRTKALVAIGKSASFRRILTGSPVTKSPMDLYSQCGFMDTELLGHDSYYSFRKGTPSSELNGWAIQLSANRGIPAILTQGRLSTKLDSFSYRVTKEEALDLPAKVYTIRHVSLTDEQIKHYMSLKNAAIALLEDGEMVTAPSVMTQLLRLQQVLCGHVMSDDKELVEFKTNRITALMETIEEMSGKVIIWSRFRYDIRNIKLHCPRFTVRAPLSVILGTPLMRTSRKRFRISSLEMRDFLWLTSDRRLWPDADTSD